MDVNGTRFHLLLGASDWKTHLAEGTSLEGGGLGWDVERGRVTLHRESVVFERPPGHGRVLTPSLRRGAARDHAGNWLFVGPARSEVRITRAGALESETYWPVETPIAAGPGDFDPVAEEEEETPRLSGLAITKSQYLIVGVPSLPGLAVFDLRGGGPPLSVPWPFAFEPVDMGASGDSVWILDRAGAPGFVRLWKLDRFLRVLDLGGTAEPVAERDFRSESSPPEDELACTEAILPGMALEIAASDAIAIEALPDGGALVLDRPARIVRVREGDVLELPFDGEGLDGPAHDIAFLPSTEPHTKGSVEGRLFVADAAGDQVHSFAVTADADEVEAVTDYLAMRMFSGKGIVAADRAYYDMGDRWLPLVPHRRRRYSGEGSLVTAPFDGKEHGCTWHRLMLDACVPAGTSVTVESRAADFPEQLAGKPWSVEPSPYLRGIGAELTAHEPFPGAVPEAGAGTWEVLFQRASGRYLQLRITLRGTGRESPSLWAARIYYPRFSYLVEYLPDVYREDEHSSSFLDRYLANAEGIYTDMEGKIADAQALFGVRTAGGEYLEWLAAWLGGVLDPDWEDARRRLFLKHAVRLFSERGTRRGLVHAIRVAVDECPDDRIFDDDGVPFGVRVVEGFVTRSVPGAVFADPAAVAGPRVYVPEAKWTPEEGASGLHARWREFLTAAYESEADLQRVHGLTLAEVAQATFPPLTPEPTDAARDWRSFTRSSLAITYADVGPADLPSFQAFLARRYTSPAELGDAWNLSAASKVSSFADVSLPVEFPAGGAELLDWVQFVSVVLPLERNAHRFSVLVPVSADDTEAERERRAGKVRRVVEVERPAHTAFTVTSYWAAMRVGEARVGLETVVGEGSRFVALAIDRDRLAQAYVSGGPGWNERDRVLVGRDRVSRHSPRTKGDEHAHD